MPQKLLINGIFLLLLLGVCPSLFGQDATNNGVLLFGLVKDQATGKGLAKAKVRVENEKGVSRSVEVDGSGKYSTELAYNQVYHIYYSKNGFVEKIILLNTYGVPEGDREGGFGFDLDISLFKEIDGTDFDILKQPLGKAAYDNASKGFKFDMDYTQEIMLEVDALKEKARQH